MENNEVTKREYKLIFNAGVVRALIRKGIPVADIKEDRTKPGHTVFCFKRTPEFEEAFGQINEEIAAARAAKENEAN